MLCRICQNGLPVLEKWFETEAAHKEANIGHYPSGSYLRESALQDCGLCRLLCSQFEEVIFLRVNREPPNNIPDIDPSRPLILSLKRQFNQNELRLKLEHPVTNLESRACVAEFEFYRDRGSLPQSIRFHSVWGNDKSDPVPERSINPDPCSDEAIGVVRSWLNECFTSEKHSRCRWPPPLVELPSRVIDVGPSDGSQDVFILPTESAHGTYAALSHCWGTKGKPTMTTIANVAAFQKCIRPDDLSANLRDAIQICRKLGIRLLWADSLCILQDSPEDWATESSNMSNIYRNACLTIAAAGAENSDEGFLAGRRSDISSFSFTATSKVSTNGMQVSIRRAWGAIAAIVDTSQDYLLKRAWCFQESLLSTRILRICKDQFHWECATGYQREGSSKWNPLSASPGLRSRRAWPRKVTSRRWQIEHATTPGLADPFAFSNALLDDPLGGEAGRLIQSSDAPSDMHIQKIGKTEYKSADDNDRDIPGVANEWAWAEVTREFTSRQLSFSSDKLPALSGVAAEYQAISGDQYVAGLWKSLLPGALLWKGSNNKTLVRPPDYRAPSWSWACYDGAIDALLSRPSRHDPRLNLVDEKYDLTIEQIVTHAATSDPFGRLSDARLLVAGLQRDLVVKRDIYLHGYLGKEVQSRADNIQLTFDYDDVGSETKTYTLLQVFKWQHETRTRAGTRIKPVVIHALILTCVDQKQALFERRGIALLREPASNIEGWERANMTLI